jgi:hypothetical protein
MIVALLAAAVRQGIADTHADVVDLFASMASALANDNGPGFMHGFDKNMPDHDKLRGYIDGLIAQAEIVCDIEPVKDEGDESKRSVDLDWILDIRSREMAGPAVRRQETVHAELVKDKKGWRIVSISPLDFFEPTKFSLSK